MASAIALWSQVVNPGEKAVVVPPADLKITNVALGDKLDDANGRTTLKLVYEILVPPSQDENADVDSGEEKTIVLCSLTGGKIEQAVVDIVLTQDESYTFEAVGKNAIHLAGNYIDQFSGPSSYSDEEDFDLQEVSSDVEMEVDPAELDSDASRFEELDGDERKPKSLKRPRESTGADGTPEESKQEKKAAKKKAKAEDGRVVPVSTESSTKLKTQREGDGEKKEKKEKTIRQEKEIAGGIKIKDAVVGTGPMARKGNTVRMRYIGKLQNGKVFDQNTKGKPFSFHLGKGEVIKGWDEGIVGMQAGGERVLTLPPAMGYGKKGAGKDIPPNATLIFEVKMLEIK